jgi:uncharacterized protein (DUF362 family)
MWMKHQNSSFRFTRRAFLKTVGGGLACWMSPRSTALASPYRVGLGCDEDPYLATIRAVTASGQWPSDSLAGRTVVIKPNLVVPMSAETGVTTDPEVVRALVDLSLGGEARKVLVIEGGPNGAPFAACGYDFLNTYAGEQVELLDLNGHPEIAVRVPEGYAYGYLYLPECVLGDDVFLVSAAKMKTHTHTMATLSMKNLVGLCSSVRYRTPDSEYRFGLHERGIHQAVLDLNLARPIDFAVVDSVWAMEGNGPVQGDPLRMDMVVAGRNALAVDRVCLEAMNIPQRNVLHLNYASRRGVGPADTGLIEIAGDSFTPRVFVRPEFLPVVGKAHVFPFFFSTSKGEFLHSWCRILSHRPFEVRVRIVRDSAHQSEMTPVRTLDDWTETLPGLKHTRWDGKDDDGQPVTERGPYAVQVQAKHIGDGEDAAIMSGTGWFFITG